MATRNIEKALRLCEAARRKHRELTEYTNKPPSLVPSDSMRQKAVELAKTIPVEEVAGNIGAVSAEYLGSVIERAGMRPADYAYLEGLSKAYVDNLLSELGKDSAARKAFEQRFNETIALRG